MLLLLPHMILYFCVISLHSHLRQQTSYRQHPSFCHRILKDALLPQLELVKCESLHHSFIHLPDKSQVQRVVEIGLQIFTFPQGKPDQ